jgi:hypothetical protein
MQLGKIYDLAVKMGIESDPRGKEKVKEAIKKEKERYRSLKKKEKELFDKERMTNPYADTRILYGEKDREVKCLLVGIDIGPSEVLLADALRSRGKKIDLIVSHHPQGYALAGFYRVMHMQPDILTNLGVPINVAEGILSQRIKEVERKVMPVNYNRAVDIARFFDTPFICIHTPCDNQVARFLQQIFDKEKPLTVGKIIEILSDIPEYKEALRENSGPKLLVGSKDNSCGKVFVEMTGGTEGPEKEMEKLSQAGVGTLVGMHYGEGLRKAAEKNHINVVVAGHIASDSLGINLFLDRLTKEDDLEILPCSGFRRFKR